MALVTIRGFRLRYRVEPTDLLRPLFAVTRLLTRPGLS